MSHRPQLYSYGNDTPPFTPYNNKFHKRNLLNFQAIPPTNLYIRHPDIFSNLATIFELHKHLHFWGIQN